MDELMNKYFINQIVPQSHRHKYHLIAGNKIIGTYDTIEDMQHAEREEFSTLTCITYIPSVRWTT